MTNSSPNKLKFASLAAKLDPTMENFVEEVNRLAEERARRSALIEGLINAYTQGEVEDKVHAVLGYSFGTLPNQLDDAIRAAIERFVVDNY